MPDVSEQGRVANAPALPRAPQYKGRTIAERRDFMRAYQSYYFVLSAYEKAFNRPNMLPVKHCIEARTLHRICYYFECPHSGCTRAGRVGLNHILWECTASRTLKTILVSRWKAVGLATEATETAIFSLTLPKMPSGLMTVAGRLLTTLPPEQADRVGGTADNLVGHCWSLGAAQYLLAVWRWWVAHFNTHNYVTESYHTPFFQSRLGQGYLGVTNGYETPLPITVKANISAAICGGLGADLTTIPTLQSRSGFCFLVAVAGITSGDPTEMHGGTMVVRVHKL
ncbi:hypothetical protein PR001_g12959 [Phytophthora rubi]|uniref:Uncharacterized protein n=1 Tax=Phytophthora rubi TaxID=129364 RepID=A0A6A3LUE9_9STRA|nr:hypothetical protein PR001_g12959 [Phytophthora rubi]